MKTLIYQINKYIFLMVMFIIRPLEYMSVRMDIPTTIKIRNREHYLMLRQRCLDHCCLDVKPDYSYTFKSLLEMIETKFVVLCWEEDHYIWWNTILDAEACKMIKHNYMTWWGEYKLIYRSLINNISIWINHTP